MLIFFKNLFNLNKIVKKINELEKFINELKETSVKLIDLEKKFNKITTK